MMPLMVDDDPAIREIFTLIAARQGHSPCTAPGGEECLALLATTSPDIVLLDIMMQPMDGWDTLTAIRSNPATRDLPVTMFSGKPPTMLDLAQYGCWIDDYLMKPLEFRTLASTLEEIVARSRRICETGRAIAKGTPASGLADEYTGLEKSVYLYRKFPGLLPGEEHQSALRLREKRRDEIARFAVPGTGCRCGTPAAPQDLPAPGPEGPGPKEHP